MVKYLLKIEAERGVCKVCQSIDCVIITNHKVYDWEWVAAYAGLIVDTRDTVGGRGNGRVVRL